MIKTTLFGSALAVALSASPAIAEDFHALDGLQGAAPAPLQDGVLAATEGGAICTVISADSAAGGFALCAALPPAAFFAVANFATRNGRPVPTGSRLRRGYVPDRPDPDGPLR